MGEGEREGIGEGLGSTGCDGEGGGVGVKVAEGDGVGDAVAEGVGLGVAGRGAGAGVGVEVAEGDGVSVVALEGVALEVAGWRRQSDNSKTAAIAAISLQKSGKDRSERRLIGEGLNIYRHRGTGNQKGVRPVGVPEEQLVYDIA